MYKLKNVARRGTALAAAVGMLGGIGASAIPALASADALNPLTERSLTLSSSSPGWSYFDGSGNSTYAPPNSGANGQKTGNTFTFRVSSNSKTIKAMTFQYCTTPAGSCRAPGDDAYISGTPDTRGNDTTTTSDLAVTTTSPTEISSSDWSAISNPTTTPSLTPAEDDSQGNFVLLYGDANAGTPATSADTYATGGAWTMSAANSETGTVAANTATGKNNLIKITSTTGQAINSTDYFKAVFFGTDGNYITNPGSGAFFVRINTYSDPTTLDSTTLVDGGVTVANVMNESISIQTKVLETMDFSVGTFDPDTYNTSATNFTTNTGIASHGQCDSILPKDPTMAPSAYTAAPNNVLQLGDSNAEYSLATNLTHEVSSYWRLSSNSSGGATVYYTGHTLTNTEGDEITPLTDNASSDASSFTQTGTEQFGLGLDVNTDTDRTVGSDAYGSTTTAGDFAKTVFDAANPIKVHTPGLAPLVAEPSYGNGAGTIANGSGPKFAFNAHSDTYAIPIASESTQVVNCVTAKMRYVANIAATTPAGIYTTKVNYVASPQY